MRTPQAPKKVLDPCQNEYCESSPLALKCVRKNGVHVVRHRKSARRHFICVARRHLLQGLRRAPRQHVRHAAIEHHQGYVPRVHTGLSGQSETRFGESAAGSIQNLQICPAASYLPDSEVQYIQSCISSLIEP